MRLPTDEAVNAEAVRLGIDKDGVCPPRARSQLIRSMIDRGSALEEAPVEDLHKTVARFNRDLQIDGVTEAVRAAAVGSLVTALLNPKNGTIET